MEEDFAVMLPYFNKLIRGMDEDVNVASLQTTAFAGQEK